MVFLKPSHFTTNTFYEKFQEFKSLRAFLIPLVILIWLKQCLHSSLETKSVLPAHILAPSKVNQENTIC